MQWANFILRFSLYLDLGLLFGVPFFALYTFKADELARGMTKRHNKLALKLACYGVVLSAISLVNMAMTMSGAVNWFAVDRETISIVITGTAFGSTWLIRIIALTLTVILLSRDALKGRMGLISVCILAGIALFTLAWGGHAVMDDGLRRYVHLSVDFAHMMAAATWLGALLAFVMQFEGKVAKSRSEVIILGRIISGFAPVGTIVVGVLVVTGLINYVLIAGFSLPAQLYGELLFAKLCLFGLMLLLAAANRFRLGPLLDNSLDSDGSSIAISRLRRSLRTETLLAFLVFAVVASLGLQSPTL